MAEQQSVTAIILAFNRADEVVHTLDRLRDLPVDEIIVVDSGTDGTAAIVAERGDAVVLSAPDIGAAARNLAAEQAHGELLLMLDDDSYPLPGAVEAMRAAFEHVPRLGLVAGLLVDVDPGGAVLRQKELGTFDWFLRAGHRGEVSPQGVPTFFFPEGGCMVRRDAFLDAGGFFGPYFFTVSEVDVATRLIQRGWDVRYVPDAVFEHRKAPAGRSSERTLRFRVRNQLWYFWLRFPWPVAARRIPAYLLFDLIECTYRGVPRAWLDGIREAWRDRGRVRAYRDPLPRDLVRRAEMNRGRLHLRLLAGMVGRRLQRVAGAAR